MLTLLSRQAWLLVVMTILLVWFLVRIALLSTLYFWYISAWNTLVLKEAKERHAIKEVKDAIIKGNVLEIVHPLHFVFSPDLYMFPNVLIRCIDLIHLTQNKIVLWTHEHLITLLMNMVVRRPQSWRNWKRGDKRERSQTWGDHRDKTRKRKAKGGGHTCGEETTDAQR